MATIKVSDLRPAGYDLFDDSESFMGDLNESELLSTNGGGTPTLLTIITIGWSLYSIGKEITGLIFGNK